MSLSIQKFQSSIPNVCNIREHSDAQTALPAVKSANVGNRQYATNAISCVPFLGNNSVCKLICEGNIRERVKNLDVLNDAKECEKIIDEYKKDYDKCLQSNSYSEYKNMLALIEKKWSVLLDRIDSTEAGAVLGEKMIPAFEHSQEIFSKMDNNKIIKEGYFQALQEGKNI